MPIVSRSNTALIEKRMNKAALLRDEILGQLQWNVGHPLTLDEIDNLMSLIDRYATTWTEAMRRCA
mgnify:CR=1 FL=1